MTSCDHENSVVVYTDKTCPLCRSQYLLKKTEADLSAAEAELARFRAQLSVLWQTAQPSETPEQEPKP